MLSEQALTLMPDPEATPRCMEFSSALAVDPGGTAIAAAIVLAVETPLPWPKPVFAHSFLEGAAGTPMTVLGPSRVLAAVPESPETAGRVRAWWRENAQTVSAQLQVDTNADVLQLLTELETVTPTECSAYVDGSLRRGADVTPAVLICTQGSHDICCGTEGTRLALQAQDELADVAVLRVSHTGGHRFSPTAMTLPDGRMWANLTVGDVRSIIDQTGDPAALAKQCRGWWAAGRGAAQVAERAVFAERGWLTIGEERTVAADPTVDGGFIINTGDSIYRVVVGITREIPSITCRAVGGLPAKPGREFGVIEGPTLIEGEQTP